MAENKPVSISLFDCNAGVGKTGLGFPAVTSADEFLAVMDRYGIDESLVYNLTDLETARLDDPSDVLSFCAASPRLHPSTMVVPPETGEQPPSRRRRRPQRNARRRRRASCPPAQPSRSPDTPVRDQRSLPSAPAQCTGFRPCRTTICQRRPTRVP